MAGERKGPDRVLITVLAVIAVLVVGSLAIVLLRGQPQQLDPKSPAGVVQRYAAAVVDSDQAEAQQYLSQRALANCAGGYYSGAIGASNDLRITLGSETVRDSTATVVVGITRSGGAGPLGSGEYTEDGVFQLVKADGTWYIDSAPYSLLACVPKGVTY